MVELKVNNVLTLRHVALDDAQRLIALIDENRDYLRRWMHWVDATQSVDDINGFIQRALDQTAKNQGPVCAILHCGNIIGVCGYKPIDSQNKSGELGYWLAEAFAGRGIMTACVRAMAGYAFEQFQLNRIEIHAATKNTGSRKIAERLGFRHEGTLREAEWVNDRFLDQEVYAILRHEWNDQ
jgi:ribosomal-protein-serine acetyltransferase